MEACCPEQTVLCIVQGSEKERMPPISQESARKYACQRELPDPIDPELIRLRCSEVIRKIAKVDQIAARILVYRFLPNPVASKSADMEV